MPKLRGMLAKIYKAAFYEAKTISFANTGPDTILDSADGFVAAGFVDDDKIVITGSANNNKTVTGETIAAGVITCASGDSLTDESAGAKVRLIKDAPGDPLYGFFRWNLTRDAILEPCTTFDDYDEANDECWEVNEVVGKRWSGSADGYWETRNSIDITRIPVIIRLFKAYYASPSVSKVVRYWQGVALIDGITETGEPLALVKQPITFTGVGKLTGHTKTTAW